MNIETRVIVGDTRKNQREFYGEIDEALEDGWIEAIKKHSKGLSFCILYKEVSNEALSTHKE